MGVIKLGGSADAGDAFHDDVDFAFPATAEGAFDDVLSGDGFTGWEVESLGFFAWSVHLINLLNPPIEVPRVESTVRGPASM